MNGMKEHLEEERKDPGIHARVAKVVENMAEEKKEAKKRPHAGHGYKSTHIDHHDDGSHTVRHEHEDGMSHKSYAKADLDQLHDGLQDHLGEANPGESEADGGQSGIEEV